MSKAVIVDLLRHGAVAAEGWAFRGRTDVALSDEGKQQMAAVAAALATEPLSQIATSPMQRCRLFAEDLAHTRTCPLTTLDTMREMDFGDWEGRDFASLEQTDSDLLHRFWQSPEGITPPNGECFDLFSQRILAAWHAWLDGSSGEHRLLVAHGGVMRVILSHTLAMPAAALWRIHLPYAAWCRISLYPGCDPKVLFINQQP